MQFLLCVLWIPFVTGCTYTHHSNSAFSSYYQAYSGVTVSQCQSYCDGDTTCQGFGFKSSACKLSASTEVVSMPSCSACNFYVKQCPIGCTYTHHSNSAFSSYYQAYSGVTVSQCQNYCDGDTTCQGFGFKSSACKLSASTEVVSMPSCSACNFYVKQCPTGCTYTHHSSSAFSSHYQAYSGVTVFQCQSYCDGDTTCKGFGFKSSACKLSASTEVVSMPSCSACNFYVKNCLTGCTYIHHSSSAFSSSYQAYSDVTLAQCHSYCDSDAMCKGFGFKSSECILSVSTDVVSTPGCSACNFYVKQCPTGEIITETTTADATTETTTAETTTETSTSEAKTETSTAETTTKTSTEKTTETSTPETTRETSAAETATETSTADTTTETSTRETKTGTSTEETAIETSTAGTTTKTIAVETTIEISTEENMTETSTRDTVSERTTADTEVTTTESTIATETTDSTVSHIGETDTTAKATETTDSTVSHIGETDTTAKATETTDSTASHIGGTDTTAKETIDSTTTRQTTVENEATTVETTGTITDLPTKSYTGNINNVTTQENSFTTQYNGTCFCICIESNFTLQEITTKRKSRLKIQKEKISSFQRKLTSASDDRSSATMMGIMGSVLLSFVGGFIVLPDLLAVMTHVAKVFMYF